MFSIIIELKNINTQGTLRGCQPPAKRSGLTATLTFAATETKK